MYTDYPTINEINSALEGLAQKYDVTIEDLQYIVHKKVEQDNLFKDIENYLEEEGIPATVGVVAAIAREVNLDIGDTTRDRIDTARYAAIMKQPIITDLKIDDQWVGGVINFQGSTFAFDYNTKTDEIFHKDEFSEELQEYLEEDFSPVTEAVNQYLFDIGFWRPAVSEIHMNEDGTFAGTLVFANTTMDFTYDPEEDVHSIPGLPEDLMDVMLDEEANIHTEIAAAAEELMEKPRSSLDNLIAEAGEPVANTNTESRNKEADAR